MVPGRERFTTQGGISGPPPEDRTEVERIHQEYLDLCHAMQSGVAMEMNYHPQPTEPKHLRVGINNALVSLGALARLLLAKGLYTELEYVTALRDEMQREVDYYTQRIREYVGARPDQEIKLG